MVLKFGAESRQIKALGVPHPEDAMRVADIDDAWLGQYAAVGQGECQVDCASIGSGLCQRYFTPREPGRTHIDGYAAVVADTSFKHSSARLNGDSVAAKPRMQQRRNATARVPTGANLGPVGVQDPHEHVGVTRRLQHDNLIATCAARAVGDRTCRGRGQPNGLGARVDHDEVVAEAVHFHKRNVPQVHASAARLFASRLLVGDI